MNQRVQTYNEALAEVAAAHAIVRLPAHDHLTALLPEDHRPPTPRLAELMALREGGGGAFKPLLGEQLKGGVADSEAGLELLERCSPTTGSCSNASWLAVDTAVACRYRL